MADNPRVRFSLRSADSGDHAFLVEMARYVCTLEGRPLAAADDPAVVAFLPQSPDDAVVVVDGTDRRLGAAWWVLRDLPLLTSADGTPLPELAIAVVESERGKGVGGALLEAVAERARGRFPALALNVHVLNPAVHLYIRAGFKVAAAGRGWYGVAMSRRLTPTWSLRPTTAADRDLLYKMNRRTMRDHIEAVWGWDEEFQTRYFDERFHPEGTQQIIQVDGSDIGTLDVQEQPDHVLLANIRKLPEWQSRGIGTSVIRSVIADANQVGKPVQLQVLKINQRARELYEREGFEMVAETDTHFRMSTESPTMRAQIPGDQKRRQL
ncbi:MAG: GNAT family N-acetyltransferase [Acidimicrobiales bacterium]